MDRALLGSLRTEFTFSVNYLHSLPWWPFLCTYSTASEIDHLPALENVHHRAEKKHGGKTERWLISWEKHSKSDLWGWNWVRQEYRRQMYDGYFPSFDHLDYVVRGGCATFNAAVPLACWMGFTQVYLLGCETTSRGYAYNPATQRRDDVVGIRKAARVAERVMAAHGVSLIDLTPGGTLPVQRKTLEEIL